MCTEKKSRTWQIVRTVATSITFLQSSHILTLKSNVEKNEALCYILLLPKVLIDKHNTEVN